VAAASLTNADIVLTGLAVVPATLTLCVLSLLVGYVLPRLARIERPQAVASAFEIGIHNAVLAITIALSPALLGNREMAVAGAVYGLLMFLPAAAFGFLITRRGAVVSESLPG
jgi:bile acid:Na+ symporter, BASS family